MLRILTCTLLVAALAAEDTTLDEPVARMGALLAALPAVTVPAPSEVQPLEGLVQMAPQVAMRPGGPVRISAKTIFDKGPTDGLEVLLCLKGGKNHEALAWTETDNAELVKGAFIAALDLHDGQGSEEESGLPARGTPIEVRMRWQPDVFMDPDRWVEVNAATMIRDRITNQAYPPLPWIYTGSHIRRLVEPLPDGGKVERDRFMLAVTKSIAVNFDEPDALLASPFPMAMRDHVFEANSALAPREKTPAVFLFSKATLPLTLRMGPDGGLFHGDQALDDIALGGLLQQYFGPDLDANALRAVGIEVDPDTDRELDRAMRERIITTAGEAGVWVAPVFITEINAE